MLVILSTGGLITILKRRSNSVRNSVDHCVIKKNLVFYLTPYLGDKDEILKYEKVV